MEKYKKFGTVLLILLVITGWGSQFMLTKQVLQETSVKRYLNNELDLTVVTSPEELVYETLKPYDFEKIQIKNSNTRAPVDPVNGDSQLISNAEQVLGSNYMGISIDADKSGKLPLDLNTAANTQALNTSIFEVHGLDVSKWQGSIDWNAVKAQGYAFVYIKSSEGEGYTDPNFYTNINGAMNTGIPAGAYHFARPDLNPNAVEEATWFQKVISNYMKGHNLRPVLDLEVSGSHTWETLSAWTKTFMDTFRYYTGITPILYINSYYSKNLAQYLNIYDLWIAHWTYDFNKLPNTGKWPNWLIWQWGGQTLNGISGHVDHNVIPNNRRLNIEMLVADPPYATTQ